MKFKCPLTRVCNNTLIVKKEESCIVDFNVDGAIMQIPDSNNVIEKSLNELKNKLKYYTSGKSRYKLTSILIGSPQFTVYGMVPCITAYYEKLEIPHVELNNPLTKLEFATISLMNSMNWIEAKNRGTLDDMVRDAVATAKNILSCIEGERLDTSSPEVKSDDKS